MTKPWLQSVPITTARRRTRRRQVLAGVAVVTLAVAVGSIAAPTSAGASAAPSCATQVNDTPSKLIPCITQKDLWNYMQDFQTIADKNPGPDGMPSRNTGEPGYKASADYVAAKMRQAGYDVTIQTYPVPYYAYKGVPTMAETSPSSQTYQLDSDWEPGRSVGSSTAQVQPAGGIVEPPTSSPSSASGCAASDFANFVTGRIALIQRGTCTFQEKVDNAQAAGASGVIVYDEGNPGRTDVFGGSLTTVPTIPVAFTSYAVGAELLKQYNANSSPTVSLNINAIYKPSVPDYNVIAESKGGDPNHVVVVDAHLDAIYGAGMLDNASGSSTILDVAQQMKNVDPQNKLRFIWFGGEEIGLYGSAYYVNNLTSSQLSHIGYDLDADVMATPNYVIGVLDPAGPDLFGGTSTATFPNRVYKASQVSRDQSIAYFDSIGKNHVLFSPVGTDAYNFNLAGVPASGLLTGQDCCKTQEEVNLFGGYTGNFEGNVPSFDGGCVDNPFRWCDNLSNNDPKVLTFMSKAFANTVVRMAFDNKVMSASNNSNYKPELPISGETSRGTAAS